jgi:hypothetical protein
MPRVLTGMISAHSELPASSVCASQVLLSCAGISREFSAGAWFKIEVRVEAFYPANHRNHGGPAA